MFGFNTLKKGEKIESLILEEKLNVLPVWSSISTSDEVEQDLLEHCLADLRVGDGVQQLALLRAGEDELAQLLPVDLPILQQDLGAKMAHDAGIGRRVWLHHCSQNMKRPNLYSTIMLKKLTVNFFPAIFGQKDEG